MATNLVAGDLIADIDGGAAVKVVANALTQTSETVYNFEVEGAHSYFVDELGLWVHNANGKIRRRLARFFLGAFSFYLAVDGDIETKPPRAKPPVAATICKLPRKSKGGAPIPRRRFPLPK